MGGVKRALAVPALLLAATSAGADTFVLRDGTSVEGQVVRTFPDEEGRVDRWEVRTLRGRRTLLSSEVREVRPRKEGDPPYPWTQFESRFGLLDPGDADGNYLLGTWAREQGMETEAHRAFRRAVAADPENARARTALGHLKVDGRWTVPPGRAAASEERGEPVAGEAPSPLEVVLGRAFARRRTANYRVESTWLDQPGLGRVLDTLEGVREATLAFLAEAPPAKPPAPRVYVLLRDPKEYLPGVDMLVAPALERGPDRQEAGRLLRLYRTGHLAPLPQGTGGCVARRTSEDDVEDRAFLAHYAVHEAWRSTLPEGTRDPDWLREAVAYSVLNDLFPDDPVWCLDAGYGRRDRLPPAWRNTRTWAAAARSLAASGKAMAFRDLAVLDQNSLTFDALVQSWSVLQTLLVRDEPGTRQFLRRVRRGTDQFQALRECLRMEPAAVDELWRAEVLKRR